MSRAKLQACLPSVNKQKAIGVIHCFDARGDRSTAAYAVLHEVRKLQSLGFDGACLINQPCDVDDLFHYTQYVKEFFSREDFALGVNVLGGDWAFTDAYRIAKRLDLNFIWTDISNVEPLAYNRGSTQEALDAAEAERVPSIFYASGVQMKYTRLRDPKPIGESCKLAVPWLDGLTLTGSGTGSPPTVDHIRQAREAVSPDVALGVASGVNADNIAAFAPYADYFLVATSLLSSSRRGVYCDRFSRDRCKDLIAALRS